MPGPEHFDVLIIGAGLSGIDAAYHLQTLCRNKSYVILEQRERIGGTWDLFRYPGIRSDSDMYTMGYSFRPWTSKNAISPGEDIREYVTDTAREAGIDRHIRFRQTVKRAAWSTADSQWTVETESATFACNFLLSCAGYYRYSAGYTPEFPGLERFQGQVVHPQFWPENLDYANKRVVIIGSGATAVTLVPAMAEKAAHVTMLQRSPTYIAAVPGEDKIANALRRRLPAKLAYRLSRFKNVAFQMYLYQLAQLFPEMVKGAVLSQARRAVGANCDVDKHFKPSYNPWTQRFCVVPDGDMFKAIRQGKASVVTDHIKRFTERGIELASGDTLAADIVVTATGLSMQAFGGAEMVVDERPVDLGNTLTYKGVMLSGVPNFAAVFGYTNASWTLKADLICDYVCRLLNHMERAGAKQVMPERRGEVAAAPFVENFNPGYVQRAIESWPKQGVRRPWRVYQNYLRDTKSLRWDSLEDGVLRFS